MYKNAPNLTFTRLPLVLKLMNDAMGFEALPIGFDTLPIYNYI